MEPSDQSFSRLLLQLKKSIQQTSHTTNEDTTTVFDQNLQERHMLNGSLKELAPVFSTLIHGVKSYNELKQLKIKPLKTPPLKQQNTNDSHNNSFARDSADSVENLANRFTARAYDLRCERKFDHANALEVLSESALQQNHFSWPSSTPEVLTLLLKLSSLNQEGSQSSSNFKTKGGNASERETRTRIDVDGDMTINDGDVSHYDGEDDIAHESDICNAENGTVPYQPLGRISESILKYQIYHHSKRKTMKKVLHTKQQRAAYFMSNNNHHFSTDGESNHNFLQTMMNADKEVLQEDNGSIFHDPSMNIDCIHNETIKFEENDRDFYLKFAQRDKCLLNHQQNVSGEEEEEEEDDVNNMKRAVLTSDSCRSFFAPVLKQQGSSGLSGMEDQSQSAATGIPQGGGVGGINGSNNSNRTTTGFRGSTKYELNRNMTMKRIENISKKQYRQHQLASSTTIRQGEYVNDNSVDFANSSATKNGDDINHNDDDFFESSSMVSSHYGEAFERISEEDEHYEYEKDKEYIPLESNNDMQYEDQRNHEEEYDDEEEAVSLVVPHEQGACYNDSLFMTRNSGSGAFISFPPSCFEVLPNGFQQDVILHPSPNISTANDHIGGEGSGGSITSSFHGKRKSKMDDGSVHSVSSVGGKSSASSSSSSSSYASSFHSRGVFDLSRFDANPGEGISPLLSVHNKNSVQKESLNLRLSSSNSSSSASTSSLGDISLTSSFSSVSRNENKNEKKETSDLFGALHKRHISTGHEAFMNLNLHLNLPILPEAHLSCDPYLSNQTQRDGEEKRNVDSLHAADMLTKALEREDHKKSQQKSIYTSKIHSSSSSFDHDNNDQEKNQSRNKQIGDNSNNSFFTFNSLELIQPNVPKKNDNAETKENEKIRLEEDKYRFDLNAVGWDKVLHTLFTFQN